MKKLLLLCIASLVLPASALAQLDMTWDNCILAATDFGEPAAVANKSFNCVNTPVGTGLRSYRAHASYKTPTPIPDFISMDISMDVQQEPAGTALQPFYRYESGGCANAGILLSVNKFLAGALGDGNGCGFHSTAWGDQGEQTVFASIIRYEPEFDPDGPGPLPPSVGRGRLLAIIARSSALPYNLPSNTNFYGFHLVMSHTNSLRSTCAGCASSAVIVWNSATLAGVSGQRVVLAGPSNKGLGTSSVNSYCAMINSAQLATCQATPTRNTTWGQLKSIYR